MNLSGTGNTNPFAPALTAAFGVSSGSTGEQLKLYNSLNDYGLSVAGGGGTLTTSTTTKKTENRITIGRDGKASISYGNTQVISRTVTEKNGNIIDSSTTNSREGTSKGDSKFKALNDWTGFIADYNSSHKTTYNFVVITITNIAMVATTIATMNPLMGPEGMVASYSLLLLSGPTLYGMQTNALNIPLEFHQTVRVPA